MKITTPSNFGFTRIDSFIEQSSLLFKLEGKRIPDFSLDLSKTYSISLPGQLLIYKFISYSAEKKCFESPKLVWHEDGKLEGVFRESGFQAIIDNYINKASMHKLSQSYRELRIKYEDNYIIAPQRLLRCEENDRTRLEQAFIKKINEFYAATKAKKLITTVLCETLTNFWAHATDDSGTVIVARGNKNTCEIICADNGQGVISTLRSAFRSYRNEKSEYILSKAFEKGVTSKPGSYHMGYGLWIIKELVLKSGGQMKFFSEGAYINISSKNNKVGTCGFWKGTVAIIKLELDNACSLADLPELSTVDCNIRWG